jgi:hypothetical protein
VPRRRARRGAQRGAALLALMMVVVMAFAYVLTSRLNAASQFVSIDREGNAMALAQAKQALIGYVAQQASLAAENNPGSLPCPEAPGNFGTANEGIAAGNCTLPAVGRLPWRTLGMEKQVDAAGEPLWYVVSPGWAMPCSTCTTAINSDSRGQLTVDGVANDAVALIIAPGQVMSVQAGAGCTAWTQARPTSGAPDLRNYLECENATSPADASFVGSRPGQTFNDQVLRIRAEDIMPTLEAAIADRMQREIAPALKTAANTLYTSAQYSGIPAGVPLYPYPAPFANPTMSTSYLGASGGSNPQGLLPFNQISPSCSAPSPCTSLPVSGTVRETAYGSINFYSCTATATEFLCEGEYEENGTEPWREVRIEMSATFSDVAMGLRVLAANPLSHTLVEARDNGSSSAWLTPSPSLVQIRMNDGATTLPDGTTPPRGSATIRFQATLPNIDANGWNTVADFRIRIQRAVFSDHFLLNADPSPATNPTGAATSWFVRNEWYRNTYYAAPRRNTADVLGVSSAGCSTNPSATPGDSRCLRLNDDSTYNIRALLVLAGRSLDNQTRHNGTLLNYVEYQNGDGGTKYEQRPMRMSKISISPPSDPYYAPWNDRIILVDWDPGSPPNASQIVSLTPLRVATLP